MNAFWALCLLALFAIPLAFLAAKKIRALNAMIDSLQLFTGRAREMQDLWYAGTGDPFIMVGGDGNIHSMNPAARRLVGATAGPVAGRPLSAFLSPGCEVLAGVMAALEDGKPVEWRVARVRPSHAAEASRKMTIRVVETGGRREAWILLGMGGGGA